MGIFFGGSFPGGNCSVGIIRVAIFRVGVFMLLLMEKEKAVNCCLCKKAPSKMFDRVLNTSLGGILKEKICFLKLVPKYQVI